MSVNRIRVAIQWLVGYRWLCVVAFDFSESSVCEEVLKEEEKRRKKNEQEEKKAKRQKENYC